MSLDKSQALNVANAYVLQRNLPAAVEIYRKLIESDPADLTVVNALGDLYASEGRVQDAITEFSRVAAGYAEGGLTRNAIATLKKMAAVDPANIETATKLADMYAQAGLPSEARHHYLQIAEALSRKGETLGALSAYNKIVDLDPSNTSGRIKLAELYLREGMNEQAYDAFVTAAEHLADGSENRRALNAYKEALAIRPDSVEVKAAARRVLIALGVADPDKSLQSLASQAVGPVDLPRGNRPNPVASDLPVASTAVDQAPLSADTFVIKEISKAEILVAYGQVDQAVLKLRNVLREQPDSIDVHIKLKDVYLRTGMMAEAAYECAELERIHNSRGEADRARDYAVRANRLTQLLEHPSGDLPEPKARPVVELEPRVATAPATAAPLLAPNPRPVAGGLDVRPAEPSRMTISVVPSDALPIQTATTPVPDPGPALQSSRVETLEPARVAELIVAETSETALALSTDARERALPVLFASSIPKRKTRSRAAAAAMAGAVFVLLGASTVIGGLAYEAHLDQQYQALALATPVLAPPAPPSVFIFDDSIPSQEENEPISIDVRPAVQTETSARAQSPEPEAPKPEAAKPEATKNEVPSPPQPITEPAKEATRPAPPPPRQAFGPDSRAATDARTPIGVPVDVPIGATRAAEPPPRLVRQSPGVVQGGTLKRVDPVYPAAARQARQAGAVTVEVMINEQGNVTAVRALSGPALLRDAALGAARAWKFKASTLGGLPVATSTTIVFNFKL